MFIIKDLNGGFGLGYVADWPVKGRPEYTPFRADAVAFDTRAEASKWLNYRTYWTGVARQHEVHTTGIPKAECNLRLAVVERDA